MLQPAVVKDSLHLLESDIHRPIFSQIFWLAYLPLELEQSLRVLARQIWTTACKQLSIDDRQTLASMVRFNVLKAMADVNIMVR